MPHTNRKKKSTVGNKVFDEEVFVKSKTSHTKRQQILGEDGWTHVVNALPRNGRSKQKAPSVQGGILESNGLDIARRFDEVKRDYEHHKQAWEKTEACKQLRSKLEARREKVGIKNVVCLGSGSFQGAHRDRRRATYTQLAALQTMVEVLVTSHDVPCTFQEPQFTAVDKELLNSLGYSVVTDPEAFTKISHTTLVYAIHCYAGVYKSIGQAPGFAVLVATNVENFARLYLSNDAEETAKALNEMVEDCDEEDFPQVRYDFSDTKIYWKKSTSEDTSTKSE